MQPILNSILLLGLLCSTLAYAEPDVKQCKSWKIKVLNSSINSANSDACFNKASGSLTSMNCSDGKCLAITSLSKLKKIDLKNDEAFSTGNPFFKYCESINGAPQLIKIDSFEQTYSRCFFSDQSFIDLGQIQNKVAELYKKDKR